VELGWRFGLKSANKEAGDYYDIVISNSSVLSHNERMRTTEHMIAT
jgi:hypothetical protein